MTNIYQNLGEEIELMEIELRDLKLEHKYLIKNMHMNAPKFNGVTDYSKDRVTGGQIPLALDEIAGRHDRIMEKSQRLKERIADKQSLMDEAKFVLGRMKGTEQKIIYLRDVMGMNLKEVAEHLGYTHQYIRKISSKMNKRVNTQSTQRQHCS